ncbi:MAG: outer membrane protein transport protein [Rhodospirillales bacterium]|nr:outer membrane protein transport protein [Rhodospirillales bacterium]
MRETRYGLRRSGIFAGVLAATVATSSAHAAGLFLYEMATPDLGTASAGRAAAADNAATAFGNPAGMARLDQSQMLVGIQPAYGITQFDKGDDTTVSGGNGGNALGFLPGLAGYYVYSATPDLKFGISLGSNFGLSARYQSNWSGRYYALQEEILTLGAFPVAAYRINKWLSVGAGAQIVYGKLNSKTGINDVLDGGNASIDVSDSDVGYGGIAGILVEPVEGTRFGLTYTSQVKLDFKEKPTTNNLGPLLRAAFDTSGLTGAKVDLGLTIPNQVMVSGYHDVNDKLAIMGNVVWQQWSEFGKPNVEITSTTSRSATADLNYDDTWGFALGTRYKFADDWSWSVGVAFDSSPQSKSNRTPALPMDQQIRVGTGVQYALNDRITVGTAYEYLNLGEADIDRSRPLAGTIQGNYSTNEIHWFNVTLSWKF